MKLSIGTQVESGNLGLGTILEINGANAKVDFNGEIKNMMLAFLKTPKAPKVKSYMKDVKEDVLNFNSISNMIKGSRTDRGSYFNSIEIYKTIEIMADAQNHFAGKIIEDARNGKNISDKQAMVVAFFAKNNGLLNA